MQNEVTDLRLRINITELKLKESLNPSGCDHDETGSFSQGSLNGDQQKISNSRVV